MVKKEEKVWNFIDGMAKTGIKFGIFKLLIMLFLVNVYRDGKSRNKFVDNEIGSAT